MKTKLNILIAPLHYMANQIDGSEYSIAYDYLEYLSESPLFSGDVLVGYMAETKMGNFRIYSFFSHKKNYISILDRIFFIIWIYFKSKSLIARNTYQLIWHNGPFAIGETFSLLALSLRKRIPFVIGPIVTPHTYLPSDESRSMGRKLVSNNIIEKITKFIDSQIYTLSKIFSKISIKTLQSASVIFAKESTGEDLLKSLGLTNVRTINLAVNAHSFLAAPRTKLNSPLKLLSVSYLVKRKSTQDLIYAISYVIQKYKYVNLRLTIVGDGPERQQLQSLVNKLHLARYISFVGYKKKDKLPQIYRQHDIFLSASVSESMPAMYLEAMASSLPLIIVANSTTPSLIKNHFGGIVVSPHHPESMAEAIIKLVTNKKLIKNYSKRNYHLSLTTYNFAKNMQKFINQLAHICTK